MIFIVLFFLFSCIFYTISLIFKQLSFLVLDQLIKVKAFIYKKIKQNVHIKVIYIARLRFWFFIISFGKQVNLLEILEQKEFISII